jgi:hypothetical protein
VIQIVGLVIAFTVVIALTAKKINVALAMMTGAIALAISCGSSVHDFALLSARSLQDPQTTSLTSQVAGIGIPIDILVLSRYEDTNTEVSKRHLRRLI